MKFRGLIMLCFVFVVLFLFAPVYRAQAQTYIQYKIQVNTDGSALWTITQVSDINGTIDTWEGFQQKVTFLIDAAANQTQREMSLDPNSLSLNTRISTNQSKTVEYVFTWQNFTLTQNEQITFGDVFLVTDFFNQLYGDGMLQISYPTTYAVKSVSPEPDETDYSAQTLEWLGTHFFVTQNPSITLTIPAASSSPSDQAANSNNWQLYALIGLISLITVTTSLTGFYITRHRKQKTNKLTETMKPTEKYAVESEEQKIIKIIQINGGSTYQSAITEQTKFSKAKTSQLLTNLEAKGVVTRYKKGREKIVTLTEQGKGEKP